jgi:hypothetical protein
LETAEDVAAATAKDVQEKIKLTITMQLSCNAQATAAAA